MTISCVDDVMCACWTADIWHYPHLMARVKSQHLCVVQHSSGTAPAPVIIVKVVGGVRLEEEGSWWWPWPVTGNLASLLQPLDIIQ